jgi:hypothetical protein
MFLSQAIGASSSQQAQVVRTVDVADPYHMKQVNLQSREGMKVMKTYLGEFMVQHRYADYHLVPHRMWYVLAS